MPGKSRRSTPFSGLWQAHPNHILRAACFERFSGRPMRPSLPPGYHPSDDEEFMNPLQVEYFRQKLLEWRAQLLAKSSDTLAAPQRGKSPKARPDRSRIARNRSRHRAANPSARAPADLQDRCGAASDRRRHLRVLRRDRRADRYPAAGGPADRHSQHRGAGAPRAHGAHPPRRLMHRCGYRRLLHPRLLAGLDRGTLSAER